MPPVLATKSISINTDGGHESSNFQWRVGLHVRISAKVCTQMGRKGSSACSATAIRARITGSESGTVPAPAATGDSRRSAPISTMERISLMTCSFSTACLLSRVNDLIECEVDRYAGHRLLTHLTMYQSSGCSLNRFTDSESTSPCRISR